MLNNKITSLLIADDHPIFRLGLSEVINTSPHYKIVAEAEDGNQAINKIKKYQPDIALLDISMPKKNGLDIVAEIGNWTKAPAFIMLSLYDDNVYVRKALAFGAAGYILKENTQNDLLTCLDSVRHRKTYLCPSIRKKISEGDKTNKLELLSPSEYQIYLLVADLKTNDDIAKLLSISIRTVENHRLRICKKLEIQGANALIKYASNFNN